MFGKSYFDHKKPLSEMPIWARLAFMAYIPLTCFWDGDGKLEKRSSKDTIITGFVRTGDVIWIYYEIRQPAPYNGVRRYCYSWPVAKPWSYKPNSYYRLTPLTDPTHFAEERDGRSYHMCELSPGHNHHVPFPFANCYEHGSWTWEGRYW